MPVTRMILEDDGGDVIEPMVTLVLVLVLGDKADDDCVRGGLK